MKEQFKLDRGLKPNPVYNLRTEGQVFELDPATLVQHPDARYAHFFLLPDPNAKETDSIKYLARFTKVTQ